MTLTYDLSGNDLVVNTITTGATAGNPSGGTAFPTAANITTTNTAQTISGVKTFSANPIFTVGNTLKSNVASVALTSNVGTTTSYFVQGTTPALVTAAAGTQTEVITLVGVAAGDIAFVSKAGGTNTRHLYQLEAVCTTDTVTVTIYNTEPTNALNGTIIFNLLVLKA